ncbi:MAG: c-type cytochrome [Myxococcales bacterium]|nr:c-type cytochrome [Myxococcales bacterium]
MPQSCEPREESVRAPLDGLLATLGATLAYFLGVALFGISALGCGEPGTPTPNTASNAEGARLYRTYCALCHGEEGEGYASDDANALANENFLSIATTEFLETAIARGRPGTPMAAYAREWGGPLSETELNALVAFIEAWRDEPPLAVHDAEVRGESARAQALYGRRCASCHGDRGQGETAMSLRNPIFLDSVSNGFLRHSIQKGRRGTPMPGFEEELAPTQIDDLVALIRTWATPVERENTGPNVASLQIDDIVLNPEADAPRFELREGRFVPADDLYEAFEAGKRMVILDARPPSDWLRFHIPGAVPAPYYAMQSIFEHLPRDDTFIIAYCACPHAASGRVVDELRRRGFEHTAVLDEGILVWRDRDYPVAEGNPEGASLPVSPAELLGHGAPGHGVMLDGPMGDGLHDKPTPAPGLPEPRSAHAP